MRPSAKELLLDPFIQQVKQNAKSILSELVAETQEEVQEGIDRNFDPDGSYGEEENPLTIVQPGSMIDIGSTCGTFCVTKEDEAGEKMPDILKKVAEWE